MLWLIKTGFPFIYQIFQMSLLQAGILVIVVSLVVIVSDKVVKSLSDPLLSILQGNWTPWPFTISWFWKLWPFSYLQLLLSKEARHNWQKSFDGEYQNLVSRYTNLNIIQLQRFSQLDGDLLSSYPKGETLFLPTRTGNLIRAYEQYPEYWYGLQVAVTWPRLWFLIPEGVQKEIAEAKKALNYALSGITWGILFSFWVIFNPWIPWAVLISIIVSFTFCRQMYIASKNFCALICSAYDLYRFNLYENLKWSNPTPRRRKDTRRTITQFLPKMFT